MRPPGAKLQINYIYMVCGFHVIYGRQNKQARTSIAYMISVPEVGFQWFFKKKKIGGKVREHETKVGNVHGFTLVMVLRKV